MIKTIAVFIAVITASNLVAQRRRAVEPPRLPVAIYLTFDFNNGENGWVAGFADYSPITDGMDLQSGIAPIPVEAASGSGFMLHGNNHSDDLFMFLKRRIGAAEGVRPFGQYVIDYEIRLVSPAPQGCGGIGGAPGESVYLKAGGSGPEPRVDLVDGHYRMTVDIGAQSQGGTAASLVSDITNGLPCTGYPLYAPIVRSHRHAQVVQAGPDGTLWLLVGTDSGFEGITTLYYQQIDVTLTPVQ